MKIVLLNTYDKSGGAARASQRLLHGLSAEGEDVSLLVREKSIDRPDVAAIGSRIDGFVRALVDGIPLYWYPGRKLHLFAPAWVPGRAVREVMRLNPDLVHLHWIVNGFVRIEELSRLNCPVIWTLHDSWPFTGGCHLPAECTRYEDTCGHCPVLGSKNAHDWSRRIWMRKQASWGNLDLTVVAPSRWIAEKAGSSSLFRNRRIIVIPNSIDTVLYSPGNRAEARRKLGLPENRKLILFGAIHALSDANKGFDLLQKALSSLDCNQWQNTELIVFGEEQGTAFPDCGMPIRNYGIISDEEQMVLLYRAADLLVAPSREETLGYVVMEAMSCGTPCAAFAVGGIPDLITHGETGYLAEPFIVDDLANGIIKLLHDDDLRASMAEKSRKWIEGTVSLHLVAQRHVKLYRQLLSGAVF